MGTSSQIGNGRPKWRLAIIDSHPVPYHITVYRAIAQEGSVDVRAFFASRIGVDKTPDPGMGVSIAWSTDLLSGYNHEFLPGAERVQNTSFGQLDNSNIGNALSGYEPHVCLILGYNRPVMLRALAWCRRRGVPAMMYSDSSLHTGTGQLARLAKHIVLPSILNQFSAHLSVGDANAKYLRTFGVPSERIFSVPYQPDPGFWAFRQQRQAVRQEWRKKLDIAPDTFATVFVGKLIARKRPGDLIEALALLQQSKLQRPIRVLFAGDGSERTQLEQHAKALNVPAHFLGFVNIDQLPALLCAADAIAHPAEIETFGVIVIEAAILGLPLVLSDRVGAIGPTSIARPGVNAITFPSGDTAALAGALLQVAQDSALAQRLGDASLAISEELDARQSVRGTLQAIDYCLRRAGQAPVT
jgi:glycosyltransferase involved in cell wall biosynthesis